jgi:3-hydroxyisobutyrate dehydrogenase-like beta-hydroxyacid dehydrogenase
MAAPRNEASSSVCVGLVGAGHMGSGLGWALREGGARVITTLHGRSPRTARLVEAAGLEVAPDLDTLVGTAGHLLVVTPPGAALDAASEIAASVRRTGAQPLVIDMNAIAPPTVDRIIATLGSTPFVDGSISGPPPTVRAGARLYFSGPRSAEVVALPWRHVRPIDLGDRPGAASGLKTSTASVYKGLIGLYAQAIRSADHYGVLDEVFDDLAGAGYDLRRDLAVAATKAHRFVAEMREISLAQGGAGLHPELFAALAEVYAEIATTPLAAGDPEAVGPSITTAELVARLRDHDNV